MAQCANLVRLYSTRLFLQSNNIFSIGCQRGFASKKPVTVEVPKRPQSQFLQYLASIREDLMKKFPGKGNPEKSVIAAQMYKSLSEEEKQKLKQDYAARLEEYKKEKEAWWNSLTPEEQAQVESLKLKRKETKALKEMSKPKKPPSRFFLFYTTKYNTLPYSERSSMKLTEVVKKYSQEWSSLPEEEKKKYNNEEEIAKYQEKLLEWEKAMVAKGVPSLVRNDVLKVLCPPKKKPVRRAKKTTTPEKKASEKKTSKSPKKKDS